MNHELEYLFTASSWSVGGLLVGYVLGRLDRDVQDIKRILRRNERRDDT